MNFSPPSTAPEMRVSKLGSISGIGTKKLESYGAAFLEVINGNEVVLLFRTGMRLS